MVGGFRYRAWSGSEGTIHGGGGKTRSVFDILVSGGGSNVWRFELFCGQEVT